MEIAGIHPSSSRMYVYQRLGEPQRIEAEYWECCGNIHKLHYDKTTVQLVDDVRPEGYLVFSVITSDPDLATRDGVRVGDPQQAVIDTYGQPEGVEHNENANTATLYYSLDVYAAHMWFQIQDDQVTEIGFFEEMN